MAVPTEAIERMSRTEFLQFMSNLERLEREGTLAQRRASTEARTTIQDLPNAARIKIAFRDEKLGARVRKLLEALDGHPGASAEELTRAMGWKSQSWKLQFAVMCQDRLGPLFAPPAETGEDELGSYYADLLAERDEAGSGYRLRPEVREALAEVGALKTPANT
jgi:hypothetical protein